MQGIAVRRSPRHHAQRTLAPAPDAPPSPREPTAAPLVPRPRSRSGAAAGKGASKLYDADEYSHRGGVSTGKAHPAPGVSETGRDNASNGAGRLPGTSAGHADAPETATDNSPRLASLLNHVPAHPTYATAAPILILEPGTLLPAWPSPSSRCSCQAKRASSLAIPFAHLPTPEHTKKRKLRHGHFRSPLLLSGPTSSASQSRPRAAAAEPTWWPSVSLGGFGDGARSRFAPAEESWTGTGRGWTVAGLTERFATTLRVEAPSAKERGRSSRRSRSRGRSRERGVRRTAAARDDEPGATLRPSLGPRTHSSPAVLGVSGLKTACEPQQPAQADELEGAELKKALLANLRARMASEGGTSKGAEAGLRFKKWALWNAWRVESEKAQYPDLRETSPASTSPSTSLLGFAHDDPFSDDGDSSDDSVADLFLLDDGDDVLPTPPDDLLTGESAEQPDVLLVADESAISPLTLLLAGSDVSQGSDESAGGKTTLPPLARPPIRRTASLPDAVLDSAALEQPHAHVHGQPRMGNWTVLRPAGTVACEG
ncbi:uncharacterized protein JCM10292_000952 [Rhodotorula paludigena]|uniref:uncharacterized protein n=1 Tax=Rhodotorula paludigena TaxID=86838 RepID=UPI00317E67EF